jgi:putative transposase
MPSRNVIKQYAANTIYHIYNRGVEKRTIFLDEQDCHVFLRYLKLYLSPIESIKEQVLVGSVKTRFINLNLEAEVDLIAFALMPNHIHLLIRQNSMDGIIKFTRRLTTSYVMYFNRKYKRTGPLFQGTYKAVIVPTDEYLQHLSGYIHRNPMKINNKFDLTQYSSFPYYLGSKSAEWLKKDIVMKYFKTSIHYKQFVEGHGLSEEMISGLRLESECLEQGETLI